ncbi:MAG: ROK family protein [Planctomycetes bacterium]|nr:ROK family protein [Planctomycetota bacterium]
METCVIGIDLGGTNMRAGVVTLRGKVLAKEAAQTDAGNNSGETILRKMVELVKQVTIKAGVEQSSLTGIGLGMPGPLAPGIGGAHPPNIPQLSGLPIVEILEQGTGLRTILENDANAAAWGEYWIGAGQGCKNMVLATLGTGIGGGIILDGKLVRGIDHTAGEIGHLRVVQGGRQCACGAQGCVEAYASANSTVRRLEEALAAGEESALSVTPREELTCAAIFAAAAAGDQLACKIIRETGRILGVLAADMANLLNPEKMIFSGGMIAAGALLFDEINAEFKRLAFPVPAARMQILPAQLGGDAGLIGAAGCALNSLETSP